MYYTIVSQNSKWSSWVPHTEASSASLTGNLTRRLGHTYTKLFHPLTEERGNSDSLPTLWPPCSKGLEILAKPCLESQDSAEVETCSGTFLGHWEHLQQKRKARCFSHCWKSIHMWQHPGWGEETSWKGSQPRAGHGKSTADAQPKQCPVVLALGVCLEPQYNSSTPKSQGYRNYFNCSSIRSQLWSWLFTLGVLQHFLCINFLINMCFLFIQIIVQT